MSHNYLRLCERDGIQRLIIQPSLRQDPAASSTQDSEPFATAAQELLDLWKSIPTGEQYILENGILELSENEQVLAFNDWIQQDPDVYGLEMLLLRKWTHNTLPEAIKLFPNLRCLDFHSATLTEIPDLVFSLDKLEILKIGGPISKIPPKICHLKALKELSIQGSSVSALPLEVCQLVSLEILDFSNNQLTALPDEIGDLIHLRELSISKNRISVLPDALGKCQQLETLHVSWNHLTKIPDSIWKLPSLRYLWSDHNQLSLLPDLEQPSNLVICNLDANLLNAIPHKLIMQLPHLKQLHFRNNPLSSVPDVDQWNLEAVVF